MDWPAWKSELSRWFSNNIDLTVIEFRFEYKLPPSTDSVTKLTKIVKPFYCKQYTINIFHTIQ